MASKQNSPEDPSHTGTEEETIAAKRKRSRRVSFADVEITSVHIFNRDDDHSDSTSSSDTKPWVGTDSSVESHENDGIGLFSELGVRSSDSPGAFNDKEKELEVFAQTKSFFRLPETPSPGSSTAGSVFSNDAEDNFFGPVSTNFIKPPMLSDSAASDENHDSTMDSTSISVHIRSLVRSDSGADMKTTTRTHLVFDDKSPAPNTPVTHSGSLMALTNAIKFTQESSVSLDSGASDGKYSNEMSVVGENSKSYEYGRLSPSLDAIFAGCKDLDNVSPYHLSHVESASNFECGGGEKDEEDARSSKMVRTMLTEEVMKDLCGVDERASDLSVDPRNNSYKKPLEVLNKFSEETKNMLGPEVHQLDHKGIKLMEDLLDDLRKTKEYEVVSFAMQQKSHDQSDNLLKKRSAETLTLLYKAAYEKAQLHLNYLKRERLQKLALDLSSAIQGAKKLKQSYKESTFSPLAKDHKVGSNCHFYPANDVQEDEVVGTLAGMKQEYEALDRKTKTLANLLYTRCNISAEELSIHTTKPIKDYLKKRMQRKLIHEDLKSWRVANFEGSLGCHSIFIDYLGFISQRITVTANPVSFTVTNKLEDRRIEEMFPKMNARCAFSYVFNEEATKESIGSITFADKIQATCFLLRCLVDVIAEVQTARLDIRELVKAAFHSPSVGRLDLHLCFVNIKSAQKVTIVLDMTCLKCGIYPSEVLPHHVESYGWGTQNLQQQSLLMKLEAAATDGVLSFGFQRIARLCKCIAQLLC